MQKAQQDGALFDPAKREKLNEAAEFPRALELHKAGVSKRHDDFLLPRGSALLYGTWVYLDQLCALSSFEKSCLGGVIQSCTQLGKIYESGRFVAQDTNKAMLYLDAACKAGDDTALAGNGYVVRLFNSRQRSLKMR